MLDTVSGRQSTRGARDFSGVEEALRDLWSTRPTRPRRGKKIAGVAAGVARRYQVDPILVRVAFVVAAFYGGAGIVAYLLGWLLFSMEEDEASPFESMISEGRSSTSIPMTLLLCAALFPAVAWLFDGAYGTLGLLMLGAALFLLHRSRGRLAPPGKPAEPAPGVTTETSATSATSATPEPGFDSWHRGAERDTAGDTETIRDTPPAWDPLGAAPFAWDLPEPTPQQAEPPPPPPPSRRSRAGAITLGATLVVGAGCVLAAPYASWLTPGHIIGVLLGVLGIGMVAASFSGGGRGLIMLVVPLSAAGILLTLSPWTGEFEGIGEITDYPRTIEAVQPAYNRTVGSVDLDLTALPDSGVVPPTSVRVGTGAVMIRVPETADVELSCSAGTGSVDCLNRVRDGVDSRVEFTDVGPDGPGGLRIKVDVRADLGSVEVYRG